MGACRVPGTIDTGRVGPIDAGTSCLWASPPPGPSTMCVADRPSDRRWHRQSRSGGFVPAFMALSDDAIAFLKQVEALFLEPYDDQTSESTDTWVRGATIGYGHMIAESDWPTYENGIKLDAAEALLRADLEPLERAVGSSIRVGLQQYEYDALTIFAFNIGKRGFEGSSVVALVNDPRAVTPHRNLEAAWKAWNRSQGRVMRGLDNRRNAEWKIYTMAVYERW